MTLEDFLKTGKLGPIAVGASMESIRDILGEPDDESVSPNPKTWKYGGLQLGFHRGKGEGRSKLAFLGLYFRPPGEPLPDRLGMQGWLPTSATSVTEFRQSLEPMGSSIYDTATQSSLNAAESGNLPAFYLKLPSGVRATFDAGRLHSLQYTDQREVETKQVSITIPKADWERINRLAYDQGVSISAFCARWLVERANGVEPATRRDHPEPLPAR